jgi:putative ABC transport system permease protein
MRTFMRDWWQDAGVALRTFSRAPGFAAAAILSIGIGVGANTAIFSVTNALLVRPLPYPDPPGWRFCGIDRLA